MVDHQVGDLENAAGHKNKGEEGQIDGERRQQFDKQVAVDEGVGLHGRVRGFAGSRRGARLQTGSPPSNCI
jgi:hypothetical protein